MTDGIIPQVINKFKKEYQWHTDNGVVYSEMTLNLIEQELIEKIKQELKEPQITTFGCNAVSLDTVIKKLIGDNQE